MSDNETVSQLGIEEGFVIHLIASLEPARVKEAEPPTEQVPQTGEHLGVSSPVESDELLGDTAEQEILAGILRTLSS